MVVQNYGNYILLRIILVNEVKPLNEFYASVPLLNQRYDVACEETDSCHQLKCSMPYIIVIP